MWIHTCWVGPGQGSSSAVEVATQIEAASGALTAGLENPRDVLGKGHAADPLNTRMLIQEVITAQRPTKPRTPQSPQQQRVTALKTQLAQAREVAQRQRLAARQVRLNQARAALQRSSTGAAP